MKNSKMTLPLADDQIAYEQIHGIDDFYKNIHSTTFLIVMFTAGSGIHYVNGQEYPIKRNQLHFLFPGHDHRWMTEPGTVAHKIVLGRKIYESFSRIDEFHFVKNNLGPAFPLTEKVAQSVVSEMESIKMELQWLTKDRSWYKIIRLRIDILASIMKVQADNEIKHILLAEANPVIENYWNLVNIHYSVHKSPKWYAVELGVTPNYLNMLCQKHINITATSMIHQRILQEAKNLLKLSAKSIKEITYILGFDTTSAFSAFFKKNCGYTPSQYRG